MIKKIFSEIETFYLSITFFTRLYLPFIKIKNYSKLHNSIRYLPLVGLLIGSFNLLLYNLLYYYFKDKLFSVLIFIFMYIFITRALHEDGLVDVFDAFGGGKDKQHIIEILKDSRIGVFGAIALIFSIAIKVIIYYKIDYNITYAILLPPVLSRFYILPTIKFLNYVEDTNNNSKTLFRKGDIPFFLVILYFIIISLGFYFVDRYWFIAIISSNVIWIYLMLYFKRKINGYKGDCLGAIQQLTEITIITTIYLINRII
ncbi:MAG TPA: adenosylcobinamide-GDP ribazoletransferase [Ignavibacteriales bacterium]|nr:adenosylcobinamide-GDP ribazoletransferase [Ignavibacteriales bacterium]HOM65319.1 adenosylcobinamide-GDP ribazoletransferase [Ignavibacteriales bacterium]HPD68093.1 adenosylcobinamide-GDP ribazoletransferase [Ignavibacteriales bacterium]HPP34559.1 adenosylcobinamide-GDP ribazoletransferase [Ignavibacteriales bacterium]HRR18342.1 adenosylcobinamide-GDP ribazoletransferase [Ignavibacteriales bacterium]